jgi:NDP-sugar pyrophosphorylase family protein
MAGRQQRFADQGYKTPKYLLPWGDRTILWTILNELKKDQAFSDVFLVANTRDEAFMPHVRSIMQDHAIDKASLVLVGDTRGQAETALRGLEAAEKSKKGAAGPIVFHNVDTILYGREMKRVSDALKRFDGFIDVFGSNNREYSYVLVDDKGFVQEIAEKIVVSTLATSGFYGFANASVFKKNYSAADDVYISSVYKKIIAGGGSVVVSEKHKEADTIVLSNPTEYVGASLLTFS